MSLVGSNKFLNFVKKIMVFLRKIGFRDITIECDLDFYIRSEELEDWIGRWFHDHKDDCFR